MLSFFHELLVDLFRQRPALARELLSACTGVDLGGLIAELGSIDLSQVAPSAYRSDALIVLRNPRRELEVAGPISVTKLLRQLDLNRESVLVVRGDTLVAGDAVLSDDDTVEIRPVISGGAS